MTDSVLQQVMQAAAAAQAAAAGSGSGSGAAPGDVVRSRRASDTQSRGGRLPAAAADGAALLSRASFSFPRLTPPGQGH
jgi:hypothetical protein